MPFLPSVHPVLPCNSRVLIALVRTQSRSLQVIALFHTPRPLWAGAADVRWGLGAAPGPLLTGPGVTPSLLQEAESPKPDSSYDNLEEMEACEDGGGSGPPKSLSSKAAPIAKGQAGDGPELEELPPALAAPGTPGPQCKAEMELEKVRMEFELTRLRYLHEENERQRQHEEVMEQLQQQAMPRLVGAPKVRALASSPQVPPEGSGLPCVASPPDLHHPYTRPGARDGLLAALELPC